MGIQGLRTSETQEKRVFFAATPFTRGFSSRMIQVVKQNLKEMFQAFRAGRNSGLGI
jgi:hypothetical protein